MRPLDQKFLSVVGRSVPPKDVRPAIDAALKPLKEKVSAAEAELLDVCKSQSTLDGRRHLIEENHDALRVQTCVVLVTLLPSCPPAGVSCGCLRLLDAYSVVCNLAV
jgi:hypothetical protein